MQQVHGLTPPNDNSVSLKKERYRVINSCLPCHRQKRRCDRKRPCSHCLKRCIAGRCVYEAPQDSESYKSSATNGLPEKNNELLRLRIAELEAALASYKARERGARVTATSASKKRRIVAPTEEQDADGAYYGRAYYLGGAAAPELLKRMLSLMPNDQSDLLFAYSGSSDSGSIPASASYMFPVLFPLTSTAGEMLQILRSLGRAEADSLLEAYFEIVDPLHHYVPAPWLLQRYESCWSENSEAEEPTAPQLALVFAVLALGDVISSNIRSSFFACISMQLLRISNFLANPTLDCIHTFSYLAVYQQHEGKLHEYWPILGLVIRLCQSMALHRDPDLLLNLPTEENELRRRAFWAVAAQETAISSMFGRPNGITFTDCKLPADISDETLFGGAETSAAHANEISYNLMTWELSTLTRDMLRTSDHGELSNDIDSLSETEQRIEQWLAARPVEFSHTVGNPSAETLSDPRRRQRYAQSICLRLIAKHDILVLYRKAALGSTLARARKPCFEAAFAISECWRELQDRFPRMARVTWMHWFRAFHAALICLVAIRESGRGSEFHSQAVACWMSFLRIFNRIKDQNRSIMSCARALSRLDAVWKAESLTKLESRRYSGSKNIRDSSDQLLISQNESGTETGNHDSASVNSRDLVNSIAHDDSSILPQPSPPMVSEFENNIVEGHTQRDFDSMTNLFDLDIQNWPAWFTNDESPNF